MGWFDKLKALVDIKIDLRNLVQITINSNNATNSNNSAAFTNTEKSLIINTAHLSEEQKKELKQITKEYIEEGNKLLKTETSQTLHSIEDYNRENKSKDKQILDFFKDVIPDEDLDALEASLFLRSEFRKGNETIVKKIKRDIRIKFGDRGNNISNLCTAGYFENFLRELYNVSKEKEKFDQLYESIVSDSVLAVFVNKEMSTRALTEEIKKKIEASLRYGLEAIFIHGIGKQNISTIKSCIVENKNFFDFFEKIIFEKENIIMVKLLIRKKEL